MDQIKSDPIKKIKIYGINQIGSFNIIHILEKRILLYYIWLFIFCFSIIYDFELGVLSLVLIGVLYYFLSRLVNWLKGLDNETIVLDGEKIYFPSCLFANGESISLVNSDIERVNVQYSRRFLSPPSRINFIRKEGQDIEVSQDQADTKKLLSLLEGRSISLEKEYLISVVVKVRFFLAVLAISVFIILVLWQIISPQSYIAVYRTIFGIF